MSIHSQTPARGGVAHYALANARVRALLSELLTPAQRRSLLEATGVRAVVQTLATTPYGGELARLPDTLGLLPVEKALERSLLGAYDKLLRTLDGPRRALVEALLRRLEVDNLKAILRGLATGRDPGEVKSLLLPLGRHSRLNSGALLAAPDLAAVVELLSGSDYGRVLRDALPRYRREGSLFPVEIALDLEYYRRLWRAGQALPAADRAAAGRFLGRRYDLINLDWLLRYKLTYRLSAVEIFNYTLPHGYLIDDPLIRSAAVAPDLPGLIAALPAPYRALLQPLARQERLGPIETALNRYQWQQARRVLFGYPFHSGVILAYLWLREAEVHDLRVILEGKHYGAAPDEIAGFLWGES